MYQNILVATGGSPWSEAAVAYATAIAARTGATLHILTVLTHPGVYANPDVMGGAELVTDVIEQDAQALLWRAAEQAQALGVRCETMWRWGNVPQTILQMADDPPHDLVVLGARLITGWKRLRLGHIANTVAAKARQPVLVVKQPPTAAPDAPLGRRLARRHRGLALVRCGAGSRPHARPHATLFRLSAARAAWAPPERRGRRRRATHSRPSRGPR